MPMRALRAEQLEQRALGGVVGAGRVAGRRADAAVFLGISASLSSDSAAA
jgi:hypothetical protein